MAEQLNWIKQYPSKVWSVGSNPTSVTMKTIIIMILIGVLMWIQHKLNTNGQR